MRALSWLIFLRAQLRSILSCNYLNYRSFSVYSMTWRSNFLQTTAWRRKLLILYEKPSFRFSRYFFSSNLRFPSNLTARSPIEEACSSRKDQFEGQKGLLRGDSCLLWARVWDVLLALRIINLGVQLIVQTIIWKGICSGKGALAKANFRNESKQQIQILFLQMIDKPNLFNQQTKEPIGLSLQHNENRSVNPQPGMGGADLRNSRSIAMNARRVASRVRTSSLFRENPMDNYFSDLLQMLRNGATRTRIQAEIATSKSLASWVREGLDEFGADPLKTGIYNADYKGRPYLRLSLQELGFSHGTLIPSVHTEKIDTMLNSVIEILSKELSVTPWVVVKIVRKYLKGSKFYPSLFTAEISNDVLKANPKLVDRFFVGADQNAVDENSIEFQIFLAKCIDLYYEEFYACIVCLGDLLEIPLDSQVSEARGLPALLLTPPDQRSLGRILWENYSALGDNILGPRYRSEEESSVTGVRKKMREVIINRKITLFHCLVRLFLRVAGRGYVGEETSRMQQRFWETVTSKMDKHMREIQASDCFSSENASTLTRQITELFLALFPWKLFYEKAGSSTSINSILNTLKGLNYDSIRPLQMILLEMGESKQMVETVEKISKCIVEGDWPVHNYHWKRWLGLFLRKLREFPLAKHPHLLSHLLWLCKTVLKEEHNLFWKVLQSQQGRQGSVDSNEAYLLEIGSFLRQALAPRNQSRYSVTPTHILPVLTASLGTMKDNHTESLLFGLLQQDLFRQIFRQAVIEHLIVSFALEEKQSEKNLRTISMIQEKERAVEQQMKLLCRIIQINPNQLEEIQSFIFERQIMGFTLLVFLCRIFQRLLPENVQDLKCLRYVMKALDAIFVNADTRLLLPVALGATESVKWPASKVIKQMVDLCSQQEGSSEIVRQSRKLRETLTTHVHNILTLSNSLDQYFPSGSQKEDEKSYERLQQQLKIENYNWVKMNFFGGKVPLKAVSWLHHLLLILESSKLTMMELEVIFQLLLKLRVEPWASREYSNLDVIVQIINKGRVAESVAAILTPLILNDPEGGKCLFQLGNSRFQGGLASKQLASKDKVALTTPKYASKYYRLLKAKQMKIRQAVNIYGEISSSLRVIEILLKLNIEGEFPLLKKLSLDQWLIDGLAGKGFFYNVTFTVQLEQKEDKNTSKSKPPKMVAHELSTSINLLHVIASLLDFENRSEMNEEQHPSWKLRPKGIYYYDFLAEEQGFQMDYNTLTRSQLNILSSPLSKDSITVSVLQIFSHIMVLGWDRQAYFSIGNRVYPSNKSTSMTSFGSNNLQSFFLCLMQILSRPSSRIRLREIGLQFLCICLRFPRFNELVRLKVSQFKEPFLACLDCLDEERGLAIMAHLLMFLNLLLGDRPSSEDIRFVKACLGDLGKLGDRLGMICKLKLGGLKPRPEGSNLYICLMWSRLIDECLLCKLVLLLYLGIISVSLTVEHQFTSAQTFSWIINTSEICLQPVPSINLSEVDFLQTDCAKQVQKIHNENIERGHIQFAERLSSWLLFDLQGSMGEDFVSPRWEAYHRALERQDQEPQAFALKSLQLSMLYSLQVSQDSLSQFYCTVILGVFQRGPHGYYFFGGKQNQGNQMSSELSMNSRAPNRLSGAQIIGNDDDFLRKVFVLVRDIMEDVWGNYNEGDLASSKNNSAILLSELIRYIANIFDQEPISMNPYSSDACRMLDKVEAYLSCSSRERVGEEALVVVIASKLKLAQAVLIFSKLVNLSPDSMRCYLDSMIRTIDNCFSKLSPLSVMKLEHIIIDQELSNLMAFEAQGKQLKYYLNIPERQELLEKLSQGLQRGVDILEEKEMGSGVKMLSLQLVAKIMQITYLTQPFESRLQATSHRLSSLLEKMAESQGESEQISGLFLTNLLTEGTASSSHEWMRLTVRILNNKNNKMLSRLSRCGSSQSLWAILEAKHLFAALANFQSHETWRNQEVGQMLNNLFVEVQNTIQKFDGSRVAPVGDFQSDLTVRKILNNAQTSFSQSRSIFSILVELRLHEMIRHFLLFLLGGLNFCPLLIEFCEKTISAAPFDEHIWERLKATLENICDFMVKFEEHLSHSRSTILAVNSSVCLEASFSPLPCRTFFENYRDEQDLLEDSVRTIAILAEAVISFLNAGKSYDWKSRLDWSTSRRVLLSKMVQTLKRWAELAKKCQCGCEVQEKLLMLNSLLADYEQN